VTQAAILVLEDGTVFEGESVGAPGLSVGEVVFNTAMTGYQEVLTDPSYARQMVTLTYPHIGNTGLTDQDDEAHKVWSAGLIVRDVPRRPSNWRSQVSLQDWLLQRGVVAISGIDTRKLTRILRERGAQNGALMAGDDINVDVALEAARKFPGLKGMDLAKVTSTDKAYSWNEGQLDLDSNTFVSAAPQYKVVAYDFGAKLNILRMLAERGCDITVVPAQTPAAEVLHLHRLGAGSQGQQLVAQADSGVRHLPGPPAAGTGLRRKDRQDGPRPPRCQPPGAGPGRRPRDDHLAEPRFRGG